MLVGGLARRFLNIWKSKKAFLVLGAIQHLEWISKPSICVSMRKARARPSDCEIAFSGRTRKILSLSIPAAFPFLFLCSNVVLPRELASSRVRVIVECEPLSVPSLWLNHHIFWHKVSDDQTRYLSPLPTFYFAKLFDSSDSTHNISLCFANVIVALLRN